ncbi:Lipoxygenase y domain-containing protein 1 [Portunus trituberculatus]|uniref:Lipoxygenase y domain-containing protein 1 n=1 Tax=Portunus trituberculatus TaxID=210409 RepID=A0A5B7I4I2_PORTR|nr:Lipoxygenase y domain-containing protein 1 [Portunus trituberculatus]
MKSPFARRRAPACQGCEVQPQPKDSAADVMITVVTGDRRGAGTDSKVFIILHDDQGRASSTLRLTNRMITNCRGQTCTFKRYSGLPDLRNVTAIELWLEKFGVGAAWFVDRLVVTVMGSDNKAVFPVLRWVKPSPHHLTLTVNDCLLPQDTPEKLLTQRMHDIGQKKEVYRYTQNVKDGPTQVSTPRIQPLPNTFLPVTALYKCPPPSQFHSRCPPLPHTGAHNYPTKVSATVTFSVPPSYPIQVMVAIPVSGRTSALQHGHCKQVSEDKNPLCLYIP